MSQLHNEFIENLWPVTDSILQEYCYFIFVLTVIPESTENLKHLKTNYTKPRNSVLK